MSRGSGPNFKKKTFTNMINLNYFIFRCLSTQTQVKAVENRPVVKNVSFVHNIFRGIIQSSQVFPYPRSDL